MYVLRHHPQANKQVATELRDAGQEGGDALVNVIVSAVVIVGLQLCLKYRDSIALPYLKALKKLNKHKKL